MIHFIPAGRSSELDRIGEINGGCRKHHQEGRAYAPQRPRSYVHRALAQYPAEEQGREAQLQEVQGTGMSWFQRKIDESRAFRRFAVIVMTIGLAFVVPVCGMYDLVMVAYRSARAEVRHEFRQQLDEVEDMWSSIQDAWD